MDIQIRTVGDDGEAASSLLRWLRDDEVSYSSTISPGYSDPHPERMGDLIECVNVVLSNGIALGSLIIAVSGWRRTRAQNSVVRIEYGDIVVELQGSAPDDTTAIVETLRRQMKDRPDV